MAICLCSGGELGRIAMNTAFRTALGYVFYCEVCSLESGFATNRFVVCGGSNEAPRKTPWAF